MENVLANLTVSKGRSSNARYVLTGDAVQAVIPQQALDVAKAMTMEPQSAEDIAFKAVIKTKQDPLRIVRYYMPTLIDLGIAKKV